MTNTQITHFFIGLPVMGLGIFLSAITPDLIVGSVEMGLDFMGMHTIKEHDFDQYFTMYEYKDFPIHQEAIDISRSIKRHHELVAGAYIATFLVWLRRKANKIEGANR